MKPRVRVGVGLSLVTALLLTLLATSGLPSGAMSESACGTTGSSSPKTQIVASAAGGTLFAAQTGELGAVSAEPTQSRDPSGSEAFAPAVELAWDDADSHKWIGAGWGSDEPSSLTWGSFHGRDCLEVHWDYPAWLGYVHTDLFPDENWESPVIGLQADVYVESSQSWIDIGIEPRDPGDVTIELLWGDGTDLAPNQWHTIAWYFTEAEDYEAVAGLVFKIDQLGNNPARVYVDGIRLLTATDDSELWDDMDDDSRWWSYSGNWYNWSWRDWGLEPVSHNGKNPATPSGSVYLQWDQANGVGPAGTTAEVGTSQLDDGPDWSSYNRIAADVKVSDPLVPLSVFLWNTEAISTPVDHRGFGTPIRRAGEADAWQTLVWDLPWPPWFDNTSLDEVKFVVNNIDLHQTGTLYVDNISLVSDPLPPPVSGLTYVLEDFDDRNTSFNDFSGNWGVLISEHVTATLDTAVFTETGAAALKVEYDLPKDSYTGFWHSLWGHSDYTQTQYLNFTDIYGDLRGEAKDFEQLRFWVRGSGTGSGTHNIKVELKDTTGDYDRTAYRYIAIDDSDTTWRQIVLDADVTNASFWSYNLEPPDPTRMKQLVFVVESYFNNPTGTFYVDDIQFVDADDAPFDAGQASDDAFLDLVSERTFLYFLDWYDPNTGLFQDRSTFPDLMSTAATGFGLTALTIGESRGWIERPLAIEMITHTLRALEEGQSTADTLTDTISSTNGYKGFYYHFLGSDGLRKFDNEGRGSELSSVDTAILMMGILTAREYFYDVPEIRNPADELYQRVEWDWMLRQEDGDPNDDQFYLAWKPEYVEGREDDAGTPENEFEAPYHIPAQGGGFFSGTLGDPSTWDYYTDEAILIDLLAIGSPSHPVPVDVFYAWAREWGEYGGHTLVQSWNGSLFTYAFAHLWIDFQGLGEDRHPVVPVDWWQNSIEATWANWQFSVDHHADVACDPDDDDYTTYGENSWGLTAAENPCPGDADPYHAYGASPSATPPDHDGTIAPYGAGMGTMFVPEKAILALKHYFDGTDLWRYRFGFGDAYNLDPDDCGGPCYNHAAFGIDQGPMLIAIESYRSGLVWDTLGRNPYIRRAMCMIWPCHEVYLPLIMRRWPPTTTVKVVPASSTVSVGEHFDISIVVDNVADLGAFEFQLSFGPSVVHVRSAEVGDFLGNAVTLGPDIDNDAGVLLLGAFSMGDGEGPSGTGVLATVSLEAVGPGSSPLNLDDVDIFDTAGGSHAVAVQDGSVAVAVATSGSQ